MAESHREEIAKLEALYASNPGGRVFVHLAEAYRKAGELELARGILAEGLTRHPDAASGFVVLGRVLVDLDEGEEAEQAFRRVLELDAGNLIALRGLGDLALGSGRRAEALDHYRELLSRNPSNEEVRDLVTRVERGEDGQPETQADQEATEAAPQGEEPAGEPVAARSSDESAATDPDDAGTPDEASATVQGESSQEWGTAQPDWQESPQAGQDQGAGEAEPRAAAWGSLDTSSGDASVPEPDPTDEHVERETPDWQPLHASAAHTEPAAASEPMDGPIAPVSAAPGDTGPAEHAEPEFATADQEALPGDLAAFAGVAGEQDEAGIADVADDEEAVALGADERELDLQELLQAAVDSVPEPQAPHAADPLEVESFGGNELDTALDMPALELQSEQDMAAAAGGSAAEFEGALDLGAALPVEEDFVSGLGDAAAATGFEIDLPLDDSAGAEREQDPGEAEAEPGFGEGLRLDAGLESIAETLGDVPALNALGDLQDPTDATDGEDGPAGEEPWADAFPELSLAEGDDVLVEEPEDWHAAPGSLEVETEGTFTLWTGDEPPAPVEEEGAETEDAAVDLGFAIDDTATPEPWGGAGEEPVVADGESSAGDEPEVGAHAGADAATYADEDDAAPSDVEDPPSPDVEHAASPDGGDAAPPVEEAAPWASADDGDTPAERGLETETMADLYRSQGFYDRAADVYRALLRRRPHDERLSAKLAEVESRVPGGSAAEDDETGDSWLRGAGTAWTGDRQSGEESPYVWAEPSLAEEPEEEGTPIGSYLQGLAAWAPQPAVQAVTEMDPAAAPMAAGEAVSDGSPDAPARAESEGSAEAGSAYATADTGADAPQQAGGVPDVAAAFDEWYGGSQESRTTQAPRGAQEPRADDDADEDDEDLAMFRSWLQSLKK